MIQSLYDILGITAATGTQQTIILIFCLVLIFFGSLCVLNAILSLISGLFNLER